ncbi:MAG TPA: acetylxylan esterase [Planctomycetota bacterium]|nr:acetylxylan esterase [Planctomycetota bacterium]
METRLGFIALALWALNALSAESEIPFYADKSNLLSVIDKNGDVHAVKSSDDWQRRKAHVLASMQRVMGPLPDASRIVPAEMKVLEQVELDKCVRRKVSFAVEKDDRLNAYLFTPRNLNGRVPAMLCLHQTISIGKAEPAGLGGSRNLHYALELAERGYVTLAPDHCYFGEYKLDVYAKGYESGTMKGIWNAMRAVDLLQSLPEVDGERIGVIGHSLGGHNSLFTASFEPRLKVVVTSCGFTSFAKYSYGGKGLINWTGKQYMPKIASNYSNDAAKMPFEFAEILGVIAPRAIFINAPVKDQNFELSGVKDCVASALPVFALYKAEANLKAVHPDCGHDFPQEIREQAYDFINSKLKVTGR